ncbi:TolC family protein [Suttonella ornithocola]|uniref:TolC family protein n=2 Tax=Suttonella ornithocola TaxID=279832 RepID=UPI0015590362|nr:TolC family protein [Suttonella ornithocola]
MAEILRSSAMNNPEILEAQANQAVSQAALEQARAARYPTVQATANQPMINTMSNSHQFTPGLKANWTLYDFGKISADIKRGEVEEQYYGYKLNEKSDEWAYKLAGYYLEALYAKMQLEAAKDNLALHNHIVSQLKIINQYDPGRRSELTQAEARLVKVQESIVSYERTLGLSLRKIARYVQPAVGAAELTDPFTKLSAQDLLEQYPLTDERLTKNSSYLAQEKELQRNQANLEIAKRARYPSIDVQAQADRKDAAVYLTMSIDVFDRKKAPAITEQQYRISAAKAQMDQLVDNLKQQAELAIIDMQKNRAQIDIADRQIAALQQVVVDYEDQFKIATRTLLNVVDAYGELAGAKMSKVSAQYQLMLAKLEYLSAVGGLSRWAQMPELYRSNTQKSPTATFYPPEPLILTSYDVSKETETKQNFVSVDQNGDLIIIQQPSAASAVKKQ